MLQSLLSFLYTKCLFFSQLNDIDSSKQINPEAWIFDQKCTK